jgi:hypothetical protein
MLRWAQSDPLAIVEGKRDDADHVGCRAAVADKDDDPKLGGIVHESIVTTDSPKLDCRQLNQPPTFTTWVHDEIIRMGISCSWM